MTQTTVSVSLRYRVLRWLASLAWLKSIYHLLPARLRNRLTGRLVALPGPIYCRFENEAQWAERRLPVTDAPVHFFGQPDPSWQGHGVNVFAYLRGQFGLAECARMYARALLGTHYPAALVDVDINLPHGWDDRSLDQYIGDDAPHRVHLVFINPDFLEAALEQIGKARLQGGYIIACWFWELENIPKTWLSALDKVDEILVASRYVGEAFARVTDKPILCVPLPLSEVGDSGLQRQDFGIPDDAFVFLTSFDFNSYVHRKNPFAAIHAFQQAFPRERQDVQLLIKTSNGYRRPDRLQLLLDAVKDDPRIVVRDQVLDRPDVQALQRCSDVYVSLHHAEGFGMGLAECMAQGKPVMGTAWSGNMEFMDADNSALVNYTLVPVAEGEYAHHEGPRWAAADVDDAARWMRRFADEPELARAMGERARTSVLHTLSPERAAAALIERIEQIHQQRGFISGAGASTVSQQEGQY
ncbi:TPA: glycosyltransferase family 4 protein [Stenotrophomonas maltophilia]